MVVDHQDKIRNKMFLPLIGIMGNRNVVQY